MESDYFFVSSELVGFRHSSYLFVFSQWRVCVCSIRCGFFLSPYLSVTPNMSELHTVRRK